MNEKVKKKEKRKKGVTWKKRRKGDRERKRNV